jgi:hypothetical protein
MAEGIALTLKPGDGWRHLGSTPETEPVEVVLRSFDAPVRFATGATARMPDSDPVVVAPGSGARLSGLHFFAMPAEAGGPCRVLVRGV